MESFLFNPFKGQLPTVGINLVVGRITGRSSDRSSVYSPPAMGHGATEPRRPSAVSRQPSVLLIPLAKIARIIFRRWLAIANCSVPSSQHNKLLLLFSLARRLAVFEDGDGRLVAGDVNGTFLNLIPCLCFFLNYNPTYYNLFSIVWQNKDSEIILCNV